MPPVCGMHHCHNTTTLQETLSIPSNNSSYKEREIAYKVEDTVTNAAKTISTTAKGVAKGVKQAAADMKKDTKRSN